MSAEPRPPDAFPPTRWTLVQQIAVAGDHGAFAALSKLCETYYEPILSVIRSRRPEGEEPEDLTQHFFMHLVRNGDFSAAASKGIKLRAFLLQELKGFLIDRHRHATAAKRDARRSVSMDAPGGAAAEAPALVDWTTPELEFDRGWRKALVANSMKDLGRSWERKRSEKPELPGFEEIAPLIGQTSDESQRAAAERLGMNANTLKSHIRSLRSELGSLIHQQVAQTLVHPTGEAVREELAALKLIGS
ncbi:MAG: sigma-70 family RNA polymerase sigma factor [Verrucomicrobiae bacterium]|nr:sigma-70 family RNA polymerase sigma factor [Verrucomicrobiae bacterium]